MNDLVKLENGEYGLVKDAANTIIDIENKIKELKAMQENYKSILLKEMEENDVVKIDIPELSVTRKAATTREALDSKTLREELPDVYDAYVKISEVKGSLSIKVK